METYALSPLQQGMLFHALYAPQSGVDIEQLVLTLSAAPNRPRFEAAWNALIARHALLRTRFVWEGVPEPVQEVLPEARLSLETSGASLDDFLATDRARGFALDAAPQSRVTLVGETEVVWTFHHAILDGRCFPPLLKELFALYEDPNAELPETPKFSEFIDWLQARNHASSEAFWRELLKGFRAPTPLTVDNLPDAQKSPGHAFEKLSLSKTQTDALKALATSENVTLNTLFQAAWTTLLHRYSGEEEIVFGATRACRYDTVPRANETIGPFINTLPVHASVTPETPVRTLLHQLRAQHVSVRAHEHTPLALVQGWSELPRGTSLFESLLVFENFQLDEAVKELGFEVALHEQTNFPLTLAGYAGDELLLKLDYDARKFSPATIKRILGHLQALLGGMAARPDAALGALPLIGTEELKVTPSPNNGEPSQDFPRYRGQGGNPDSPVIGGKGVIGGKTLHEIFEARAATAPDAVALSFEETRLTYAELNARANRLAHRLKREGVGSEALVGLLAERSAELVVGLLAILKAGGAYLPIDTVYPAERAAFMLDDAKSPVLLTQRKLAHSLPETDARILFLDDDFSGEPSENLASGATEDSLAYVIFTSGSTGKPKGVEVTHKNVARLFASTDHWFGFGPSDVWTLFHSHAFDFSVWEIWGALLYGGRLVVVPFHVSRSPEDFHALLAHEGVTVLNQTPSAFRQLIVADEQITPRPPITGGSLAALRYVIFGGEALELASLAPWYARHADDAPRLVNMYGITETTVHVTYRPLSRADVEEGKGSVIGEPIPDLGLYILDPSREPTPIGVPGELYVSGAGLARGYLARPELTAERFIPSPFVSGERLYKTGDLARWLPDGDIEYLGRIDQQVKIRGFRIELGEIETALLAVPGVREAAVVAREDVPGVKQLVGYLVGDAPSVADLRETLAERLPSYMIPAAFVTLDALPLTNNGKLDKRALPAPQAEREDESRAVDPPRNDTEARLLAIWKEVLRQERIGIHDSFFERGGDSILSIHILSKARQAGLKLTARQIFERPTIARLAEVAERAEQPKVEEKLPDGAFPLTPIQKWFFDQNLPDASYYNQAFVFTLNRPIETETLEVALAKLCAHHDALRLRFARTESGWEQVYGPPVEETRVEVPAFPLAELSERAVELQSSLSFTDGPLLRAARFTASDGSPDRLLLAIHHLAVDGVSWRILLEDLDALCAGRPLPPKSLSFGGWAALTPSPSLAGSFVPQGERGELLPSSVRACEDLTGEGLGVRDYWRSVLSPPALALPTDSPKPASVPESSARTVYAMLTEAETQELLTALPAAFGSQIDDALLAALSSALSGWLGAGEVLLDREGHGREELFEGADVSRTVGWFTSLFPMRLMLGAESLLDALKRQKEARRALPLRGVGFGYLKSELPTYKAEISFNFLGQLDQVVAGLDGFGFAPESSGPWHGAENPRPHLLEVLGQVKNGRLAVGFTYSESVHDEQTVVGLAERFETSLRELLSLARAGQTARTPSDFPLACLTRTGLASLEARFASLEDVYPLSPMQALFYSVNAGSPALGFEGWRFALTGAVDSARLKSAWESVLARHTILRTAFVEGDGGEPLQVVQRSAELPWNEVDLRGLSEDVQRAQIEALVEEERNRGFDLERAPLVRIALVRLSDDASELLWSTHHLLIDGWSWPLVFGEVTALYENPDAALPRPTPYREFIAYQQAHKGDGEAFWRAQLDGVSRPTPLPARRGSETTDGELRLSLPEDATAALSALARSRGATTSTLVQGAWALVLGHHAAQTDVVFGASFSGRPAGLPGALELVGPFVNNLPVRAKFAPSDTLLEFFAALQKTQIDLSQHQDTSPVQIQEWSRVPLRFRLFDSLVVFQNYQSSHGYGKPVAPERSAAMPSGLKSRPKDIEAAGSGATHLYVRGLNAKLLDSPDHTAFPLTLVATPAERLELKLAFHGAQVDGETARVLLSDLETALQAIVARPEGTVGAILTLLPPAVLRVETVARVSAPGEAPRSQRERELSGLWADALGVESVGLNDNFFEMGAHSLLLVAVHRRMRSALELDIPLVKLFQYPTISSLARYLEGDSGEESVASAAQDRARKQREALARQRTLRRR